MNSLRPTLQVLATLGVAFGLATAPAVRAADDLLIADFEGSNYGDWKVTGEAFGFGPARGTLPNQMRVEGFLGKGLANSFHRGDGTTGTLTSASFKIARRYLRFLIGGGGYAGETCLNLLVDGRAVRTATGPNAQAGGSERLDWEQWDVSEFSGREAVLQIVDARTGGWGHINVDHILQTEQKLPGWILDAKRELMVEKRYLNIPVKNGAPKRLFSFLVEDRLERQLEIELADADPDWWAFLDLTPFHEKKATLKVDKLREDSAGLNRIEQSDTIKDGENLYREKLRPQFHFSARRGWNNDPNGLVYYEGEYHLFFQQNPYGWSWGNMHWGHAVSRDLVHWEELPMALYPDALGTMFSGSAIVDELNTTGFQSGADKPIVCMYTAAGGTSALSKGQRFTQCLAYSTDRGRTWTKFAGNPVLGHIAAENRDPKVIWYAPQQKWVMALFLDRNDFALFSSLDLKKWERLCDVSIPGSSECPEFFELPVAGSQTERRWIFYGANGLYLLGSFDGKTFAKESGPHGLNFGNAFYASQTFNGLPASDNRRILMPWGTMATPGMPFNQMIGLPVELTLRPTPEGLRLFAYPVKELEALRSKTRRLGPGPLGPDENPLQDFKGELFDLVAEISPGEAAEVGFVLRGVPISYDVRKQELACRDKKAALPLVEGKLRLRLLLDRTSIDIFGNDGQLYMPMGVIPPEPDHSLAVYARAGTATLRALEVHELRSAWAR